MNDHDHGDDGEPEGPVEIAFVGDLTDNESDLTDRILDGIAITETYDAHSIIMTREAGGAKGPDPDQ